VINFNNVSKSYTIRTLKRGHLFKYNIIKKEAVKNLNFRIYKSDLVGYVGLNGSGKSTTIKLICGLLYPDSGQIKVNGQNPFLNKDTCYNIGAVFGQKQQLWVDLPVRDSYELLRGIYKVSKHDYHERLEILDSLLEISTLLDMPARKLSLGQRMKCEFAATLIHWPQILLLDEPAIGIDFISRKKIVQLISLLNKKYGKTIVLTTHNLQDIETLCNRVMVIDKGEIIYDGSQNELKAKSSKQSKVILTLSNENSIEDIYIHFQTTDVKAKAINGLVEIIVNNNDIAHVMNTVNNLRSQEIITKVEIAPFALVDILEKIYSERGSELP
jgi:ABC-2 type transport system ATP-binding protein